MAKIELELAATVIAEQPDVSQEVADRIVRQLTRAAEKAAEEANEGKEPAAKKQFVVLVYDQAGEIPDGDYVATVLQLPENDPPATAIDRLQRAADAYNCSRRGQKFPVKSVGEAAEVVGGRFLKEHGVWVKTKLPVQVIVTNNELVSTPDEGADNS